MTHTQTCVLKMTFDTVNFTVDSKSKFLVKPYQYNSVENNNAQRVVKRVLKV